MGFESRASRPIYFWQHDRVDQGKGMPAHWASRVIRYDNPSEQPGGGFSQTSWDSCEAAFAPRCPVKKLLQVETEDDFSDLRRAEDTGRPLGAPEFVTGLEKLLGRKIARPASGRRPKIEIGGGEQPKLR